MKVEKTHPRFRRRALPWAAATLALMLAGAGTALADDDSDYRHRDSRGHYDRDYDHDHRYDRHHRRDHRRDYRYDRRYDSRYRDGYYGDRRYDRYRYNRYDRRHRIGFFEIPKVILHDLIHHYRPYRYGRMYYSKHRHYHEIYRFPVYSDSGVEYHPYAYCEGKYYNRGSFRNGRPSFDINIRF